MAVPTRTCVACRQRHPASELLRLTMAGGGRVCVSLVGTGRGAWVCARRDCVERLARKPGRLARSLRGRVLSTPDLLDQARTVLQRQAQDALLLIWRQGLVVRPVAQPAVIGLVLASDAGSSSIHRATTAFPSAPAAHLGLNQVALGALLGRGPRAVLAVRDGRYSRRFLAKLQRYADLG